MYKRTFRDLETSRLENMVSNCASTILAIGILRVEWGGRIYLMDSSFRPEEAE